MSIFRGKLPYPHFSAFLTNLNDAIARAAELIAQADGLLVTAGAGMGVDSGLPDFRGEGGFWKHYPALGRSGIGFTAIACPDAFRNDPRLAWGFYGHRLRLYRETTPHEGFQILRRWAKGMAHGLFAFTSNVDGQFPKAGFSHNQIMEAHGSIHHLQCLDGCREEIGSADDFDPVVDEENCLLLNDPPTCPHCGSSARPNVLMFGDWDWQSSRADSQRAALDGWRKWVFQIAVIEIGAGTDIPTVRNFGELIGEPLIRINPNEPGVHKNGIISLRMGGLDALRKIDEAFNGLRAARQL